MAHQILQFLFLAIFLSGCGKSSSIRGKNEYGMSKNTLTSIKNPSELKTYSAQELETRFGPPSFIIARNENGEIINANQSNEEDIQLDDLFNQNIKEDIYNTRQIKTVTFYYIYYKLYPSHISKQHKAESIVLEITFNDQNSVIDAQIKNNNKLKINVKKIPKSSEISS